MIDLIVVQNQIFLIIIEYVVYGIRTPCIKLYYGKHKATLDLSLKPSHFGSTLDLERKPTLNLYFWCVSARLRV